MNALEIIKYFYPDDTPLRRLLLAHSVMVRDKALAILASPACTGAAVDAGTVADGAMLHDIGIKECHAPGILCRGFAPYIAHGVIGARMLREYGAAAGVDLERFAGICERHTGSGLTAGDIHRQSLPIPERDYLPVTMEEKLVCLADKFFSKSGDMREKEPAEIRNSMVKFGSDSVARFDDLCKLFGIDARERSRS